VKNALLFGGSGGLAKELVAALERAGIAVDIVTRAKNRANFVAAGNNTVSFVDNSYAEFTPQKPYDIVLFTQSLFPTTPLADTDSTVIAEACDVGLVHQMQLTHKLLQGHDKTKRQDFCYIGSTSAYAGFKNTSVYCAVKHALVGFVKAMNDEFAGTATRFWLFSMGTMRTEMGMKVVGQDPATFLDPADVARRIVGALTDEGNMFEPEIVIRRRTIGWLK